MLVPVAVLIERVILECLQQFNKNDLYVYDGNTLYKSTEPEKDNIKNMQKYYFSDGKWIKS